MAKENRATPVEYMGCAYGQVSRSRIGTIENAIDEVKGWTRRLEAKLDAALRRPGWPVTVVISVLMAAIAVLATLLAAGVNHRV